MELDKALGEPNPDITVVTERTDPMVEVTADQAFHLDKRQGQFLLRLDAWSIAPEHVRAVLDCVWPVSVKRIEVPRGVPEMLHFVAYCPLFRALSEGDQVPKYNITTRIKDDAPEGAIEVIATEQEAPNRIIELPQNWQQRRHPERYVGSKVPNRRPQ